MSSGSFESEKSPLDHNNDCLGENNFSMSDNSSSLDLTELVSNESSFSMQQGCSIAALSTAKEEKQQLEHPVDEIINQEEELLIDLESQISESPAGNISPVNVLSQDLDENRLPDLTSFGSKVDQNDSFLESKNPEDCSDKEFTAEKTFSAQDKNTILDKACDTFLDNSNLEESLWNFVPTRGKDETLSFNQRMIDNISQNNWTVDLSLYTSSTSDTSKNTSYSSDIFSIKEKNISLPYKLETLGYFYKQNSCHLESNLFNDSLLSSVVSKNELNVSIENQVFILSAETCEHLTTLTNDTHAKVMDFSNNSLFIAYGDQSGKLLVLHSSSKAVIFSRNFSNGITNSAEGSNSVENCDFISLKFIPNKDGSEDLYLFISLNQQHVLTRYRNLNLQRLHEALIGNDVILSKKIREAV
ncbi:hypothetical protein BB560_001190 [Smittium megazygosporum]|uniref:KNTC1 N-terminal domain-containing protein n=1 Tax=Smittium megazygosporum TaxID=133381 RepID=A0A2T9ZII5_9FUNG|nr:hypothetical protein BB560_001190 [Smittium megazygosporum]